jgi:hypothetical protein
MLTRDCKKVQGLPKIGRILIHRHAGNISFVLACDKAATLVSNTRGSGLPAVPSFADRFTLTVPDRSRASIA